MALTLGSDDSSPTIEVDSKTAIRFPDEA